MYYCVQPDSPTRITRKKEGRKRRMLMAAEAPFDHMMETAESRFALSPSGLGMDTYRLWQALLVGTVPVVESNAGLDRTYSSLPVLVSLLRLSQRSP